MKRQIAMIALLFLGMGMTASAQFGKKFNVGKALQAGKDVVSAVTLSDADIANMSKEYMVWMDAHNPLTKPDSECFCLWRRQCTYLRRTNGCDD